MQTQFELTPKQAEYIREADHRWNVSCGAVRSGKSYLQISYLIPQRLFERKEKRGLKVFLGATRANIERNILQPIRDLYGNSAASEINSKNYASVFSIKVYCIGADNVRQVSKLRGSEIAYCAIDEATDINQEVFEMLKSRLSLPWSCCDITTNPSSPNHYFKEFLDSRDQGVDIYLQEYTIFDNPFLPSEYVKALQAEYAGSVWYDRYILGKWTLAEGLVYPEYMDALFEGTVTDVTDFCLSLDYGTSNPFAVLRWELKDGVWYATKELYYSGRESGVQKTDDEYLNMLESFIEDIQPTIQRTEINVWGEKVEYIDKIPVIIDPSAASFIALLRKSKWFKPVSANNDVVNGIRDVNTAMKRGIIKVHNDCKNWKNECQSYVWDEGFDEDRPIKDFDHLMDAMRYFVKTKRLIKPIEMENYVSIFGGQ